MLIGIIVQIVVSLVGFWFTHRRASDAARMSEENARSLMALHLEMGHVTAAEKRRELARYKPSAQVPDPRSHIGG